MALVSCVEKVPPKGSFTPDWKRAYTRTLYVETDDKGDGPVQIRIYVQQTLSISIGTHYSYRNEYDTGSFVQTIEPECLSEDGLSWNVVVTYGPYDATQFPSNPLECPIKINWGFAQFEKKVDVDIDGNAIVNSAGQAFVEAIPRDDSRPVLTIQRNEPTYDPARARAYKDAINSDQFFGADPFYWKVADLRGELQWNGDVGFYYSVTYEFHYNEDTWIFRVADNGKYTLSGSTYIPVVNANGFPSTDTEFLDGSGKQLTPGAAPVWLEFHIYREVAFADLALDPAGQPGQGNG